MFLLSGRHQPSMFSYHYWNSVNPREYHLKWDYKVDEENHQTSFEIIIESNEKLQPLTIISGI